MKKYCIRGFLLATGLSACGSGSVATLEDFAVSHAKLVCYLALDVLRENGCNLTPPSDLSSCMSDSDEAPASEDCMIEGKAEMLDELERNDITAANWSTFEGRARDCLDAINAIGCEDLEVREVPDENGRNECWRVRVKSSPSNAASAACDWAD